METPETVEGYATMRSEYVSDDYHTSIESLKVREKSCIKNRGPLSSGTKSFSSFVDVNNDRKNQQRSGLPSSHHRY